eukprot:CAMPEP_0113882876 /NCGR_PEP_ID=MMETSP0780_2-20120614/9239_1 /TAXON_ID=652834 /ORGANISM="Palpitomonas bilix" /LENGTH=742 /DNA_ID=CAMNT_0000870021 /DNA_START=174 /DNA_END=2402 /DNA_ORIENTATION=- /assembly_acc=CAM_ASM_000599
MGGKSRWLCKAIDSSKAEWGALSKKRKSACLHGLFFFSLQIAALTYLMVERQADPTKQLDDSFWKSTYFPKESSSFEGLDNPHGVILTTIPKGPLVEQLKFRSVIDTWLTVDKGIKVIVMGKESRRVSKLWQGDPRVVLVDKEDPKAAWAAVKDKFGHALYVVLTDADTLLPHKFLAKIPPLITALNHFNFLAYTKTWMLDEGMVPDISRRSFVDLSEKIRRADEDESRYVTVWGIEAWEAALKSAGRKLAYQMSTSVISLEASTTCLRLSAQTSKYAAERQEMLISQQRARADKLGITRTSKKSSAYSSISVQDFLWRGDGIESKKDAFITEPSPSSIVVKVHEVSAGKAFSHLAPVTILLGVLVWLSELSRCVAGYSGGRKASSSPTRGDASPFSPPISRRQPTLVERLSEQWPLFHGGVLVPVFIVLCVFSSVLFLASGKAFSSERDLFSSTFQARGTLVYFGGGVSPIQAFYFGLFCLVNTIGVAICERLLQKDADDILEVMSSPLELRVDGVDEVSIISRTSSAPLEGGLSKSEARSAAGLPPATPPHRGDQLEGLYVHQQSPIIGRKRLNSRDLGENNISRGSPNVSESEFGEKGRERRRSLYLNGYSSGGSNSKSRRGLSLMLSQLSANSAQNRSPRLFLSLTRAGRSAIFDTQWIFHVVALYLGLVGVVATHDMQIVTGGSGGSQVSSFFPFLAITNVAACVAAFCGSVCAWLLVNVSNKSADAVRLNTPTARF